MRLCGLLPMLVLAGCGGGEAIMPIDQIDGPDQGLFLDVPVADVLSLDLAAPDLTDLVDSATLPEDAAPENTRDAFRETEVRVVPGKGSPPEQLCEGVVCATGLTCKVSELWQPECVDIDECATNNGGCAIHCNNTVGSYHCSCDVGFALTADGKGCADVIECLKNNGGCDQICTNTVGGYVCSCEPGYVLNPDGLRCDDINECLLNNGGCQQICNNVPGSWYCSCHFGFTLNEDNTTCTENECLTGHDNCHEYAICTDTATGWTCECMEGWFGNGVRCSQFQVGCSDGTREGFVDLETHPLIAACAGAWNVPGIHHSSYDTSGTIPGIIPTPACNRAAGNSGYNSSGTGCNVEDLCADGWHVCFGKNDVLNSNPTGCAEVLDGGMSPAFYVTRSSSTGAFNCRVDYISQDILNDVFGCGNLGCTMDWSTYPACEPLNKSSHDGCVGLRLGGRAWCQTPEDYPASEQVTTWFCGSGGETEASLLTKIRADIQGGVLCCQDYPGLTIAPNGQVLWP